MQVSSTLIAAQQAAREAQARFQAAHVSQAAQSPKASFAAALQGADSFAPLPLRQTAPSAAPVPAQPQAGNMARPGSRLDITV